MPFSQSLYVKLQKCRTCLEPPLQKLPHTSLLPPRVKVLIGEKSDNRGPALGELQVRREQNTSLKLKRYKVIIRKVMCGFILNHLTCWWYNIAFKQQKIKKSKYLLMRIVLVYRRVSLIRHKRDGSTVDNVTCRILKKT